MDDLLKRALAVAGGGLALWILGLMFEVLVPSFMAVSVVLVAVGHLLFFGGLVAALIVAVVLFVRSLW